jgi:hypothetical protein
MMTAQLLGSVFYVPANDTRGIVFSEPFMAAAVNVTWKLKDSNINCQLSK